MFGCGSTDINDLITNTVGACIGYYVYVLLHKIIPDSWHKVLQVNGVQCYFEPTVYWILSLLIMTTIQLNIFHMLF